MQTNARDAAKMALSMAIFGTVGIFTNLVKVPTAVLICVRATMGLAFLGGVAGLRARRKRQPLLDRRQVRTYALPVIAGGVGLALNWILLFEAYRLVPVALATMLNYLSPIAMTLLAPRLFGEQLSGRKFACMVVALAGSALMNVRSFAGQTNLTGIALAVASAVFYSLMIWGNKRSRAMDPSQRTLAQFVVVCAVVVPYTLATQDLAAVAWTPMAVGVALVMGVVHTGLAYLLYFDALAVLPVQVTGVLAYVDPVVAVSLSAVVLGQVLAPVELLGCAVVIGAMVVAEFQR